MNDLTPAGTDVPARRVVRAACPHDCPDSCAMQVTVEGGRAVKVEGAQDHPFTRGVLCTKVSRYLERTYHPDRLMHPMKRAGRKGEGRFARISWDEALDTIAARLRDISASPEGPGAILPYDYAGTMGHVQWKSMGKRLFHRLGASLLERGICSAAGKEGIRLTLGASVGMDPERFDEAKLILVWGTNPIVSNLHQWTLMQEAKRRGAKLVAIDPYRSLTAEKCHEHIAPLPGTDAALALGMMHVIIGEGRYDRDYVERYTLGFAQLAERVRDYPPGTAAKITGVPAERIVALAREYAAVRPAAIRMSYGLQRYAGGASAVRTITCLPALTGAWRDAAGGVLLSTGGWGDMNAATLERPDLLKASPNPNPRTINMSAIGDALLQARPAVRALYVYNSNPVAVAPHSRRVVEGFSREDLFCVVHDLFQTDTADYADILLPATSQLEQWDVHTGYGHLYVLANCPAIAPLGEALPNAEVFRRLAARLGFDEPCFRDSDEDLCRQAIASNKPTMQGMDWERLKREGFRRFNLPQRFAPFAQGGFPTPSGKCEFSSETARAMGVDPLPTWIAPRESVHAAPELAQRYPLAMISPPARNFLNSSFANLDFAIRSEGEPHLDIHPEDAAARGIHEGDLVRITNDRGEFQARARVSERARTGVVVALSGWWKKLSPDGRNANEVTSQALTDLGGGATFYDCLVEVARVGD